MSDEKRRILEMVADGTITQEDGERLLAALGPDPEEASAETEPDPQGEASPAAGDDLGKRISDSVEKVILAANKHYAEKAWAGADSEPAPETDYEVPGTVSTLALSGENAVQGGVHSLEISWVSGKVEILPWEGTELRVTETANRPMKDGEQMSLLLEDGVLSVGWTQKKFRFGHIGLEKRLLVEIPEGQLLRSLSADSVSAPVRVEGTPASQVKINTVSGKLEVFDTAAAGLALATVSGKLNTVGFAADTAAFNTVSGKLEARGSAREITAETVSGKLEMDLEALPEKVGANTVSGKIEVSLLAPPEDSLGFTVQYESVSGVFESDFPLIGELKKHHGRGVFGGGESRIDLETATGKIELWSK